MILPPTIVIEGAPLPDQPPNGVLRDLLWNRSGSTFHSASRSSTVTSAGLPGQIGRSPVADFVVPWSR